MARTLEGLGRAVEGDQRLSVILVGIVDQQLNYSTHLQEISTGSIRLILQNVLANTKNVEIKEKGVQAFFGQFLIECKGFLLDYLSNKDNITKEDISDLREGFIYAGKSANIPNTIELECISDQEILDCLDAVTLPAQKIPPEQNIHAIYNGKKYKVNKAIKYDRARIEESLAKKERFTNEVVTVVVKKPDYMGASKWDIYCNGDLMKAKILHEEWLHAFQNGQLTDENFPKPKDSMKVVANLIKTSDPHGYSAEWECEVVQVVDVIKSKENLHLNDNFDF